MMCYHQWLLICMYITLTAYFLLVAHTCMFNIIVVSTCNI